jgi:hypothetical protein
MNSSQRQIARYAGLTPLSFLPTPSRIFRALAVFRSQISNRLAGNASRAQQLDEDTTAQAGRIATDRRAVKALCGQSPADHQLLISVDRTRRSGEYDNIKNSFSFSKRKTK